MLEFDPHVLDEKPIPPPEEFSKRAHVKSLEEYRKMFEYAERDPEGFWGEQAKAIDWFEPYSQVLEWKLPHAKWFVGGKLNVSYNCLDRHVEKDANKPALFWEAEDGATLELTYAELLERVCRFANALLNLGVKAGDCVAIYLPMIPELPISMLACARIGAIHSVIFGGFSATALVDRIADAKSKILITADGGYRRGKVIPLKDTADAALKNCPTIEKSIVVKRTGEKVTWEDGRDLWWHELEEAASKDCPAAPFDSEHPLYILYTSGTTGKPKGVIGTTGNIAAMTSIQLAEWEWPEHPRFLMCTPLSHAGAAFFTPTVVKGGEMVVLAKFDPAEVLRVIEEQRITATMLVPSMLYALMDHPDSHTRDLSSLETVYYGASAINPEIGRAHV